MVGKQQVRFLGAVWNCIDDFPLNEKVDVVIRPEDVEIGNPGKGTVDGVIASRVFKGEDYSYVINVGKNEVLCRDTHAREVGSQSLDPRRQREPPDHAQGSHRERMGRCLSSIAMASRHRRRSFPVRSHPAHQRLARR
jgi:ABC-type Fe3+/spermidine/putrescine transport system ATPase subunit